jgi:manganese oxidase
MTTRRQWLGAGALLGAAAAVSRPALAALPEAASRTDPQSASPLAPSAGRPYRPVVTLNGWSLPFRMKDGVKEFHLVAEPVERELAPGMVARLWGYNGSSPGPTIEVVEGDKLRLFVTNRLPEHTAVHWHGQRLPNGMDGVGGLTQPQIKPGQTFVYEFEARRPGTFMYHPHADEMVQMAMGMMGFWVTHPKDPARTPGYQDCERDYCFLLNAFDIEPGAAVPKVNTMLDFNLWCWNSRVFPAIDPLVARKGERVRMRVGNLTMTNHPIHLHGHEFVVAGTDGGWTHPTSRWPEVTADIAVGQMRTLEFIADEVGDWALHCHKSHHTMNPMGHSVPNMIGVDHREVVHKIQKLVPDYMVMGERGMADMGEMEMPLPDNTLPMMTGHGQYGPLEMGGMFTTLKVREDQPRGDYRDPGPYRHPQGSVARLWEGATPQAARDAPAPAGATHQAVKPKPPEPGSGQGGHKH